MNNKKTKSIPFCKHMTNRQIIPFWNILISPNIEVCSIFHFGWKNTLRLKLWYTVALCTRDDKKRDYIRTNTIAKLVKSS